VSLRRSPTRTAAFLAANRSNARKSTGPRTVAGKARVAMNSVRQGRRAFRLRQNLVASGAREQVALYDWILGSIWRCYDVPIGPDGRPRYFAPEYGRQVESMARWVFSTYLRAQAAWLQAKPESPFAARRFTNALPLRIRIESARRTRRLAFWLQPGRGPNYFQPADKQSINRRYREICRRRRVRPRGDVLAGIRPQPPGVEVRDERGTRLAAVAEAPEARFAYWAKLLAAFDTAARAQRWARCRILPPTPRVMIYRRVKGERGLHGTRSFIDYRSECFNARRCAAAAAGPRSRRERYAASTQPSGGLRPARGPGRRRGFFRGWVRDRNERPAAPVSVRAALAHAVGAIVDWARKLPSSLGRGPGPPTAGRTW
jgi:hypothetical protein